MERLKQVDAVFPEDATASTPLRLPGIARKVLSLGPPDEWADDASVEFDVSSDDIYNVPANAVVWNAVVGEDGAPFRFPVTAGEHLERDDRQPLVGAGDKQLRLRSVDGSGVAVPQSSFLMTEAGDYVLQENDDRIIVNFGSDGARRVAVGLLVNG